MPREAFAFFHRLRVRWAESDPQGVVFNGHYLTYFDVGITEFWRALGIPYPSTIERFGLDLFVVKATLEYHAPAHYDDLLDVGVRLGRIGNSSVQFLLGIYRETACLVSGEVVYVAVDAKTRRPQTIPPDLRAILMAET
ncbi:putative esterase [Meiothermus luteus]|jgi:acyl-CoA thioester hydrolase|uniref:Putative esterase n=1 Tax=Meiothermus luteus TaxID=2026184 RepID=A0A399EEX9_9DEIN|nr:thioesterase family protein [Meiothermus luteus]RIH81709.1 putative esterase [Meiothermus luteus]RMH54241.1 MAG: YbgC/FadM family acyl-CoA thioesterase [Deinococcota bacterium]